MHNLVITHKNCIDGRTAQAIFRRKNLTNTTYFEMTHADFDTKSESYPRTVEILDSFSNSNIYMADFCLPLYLIKNLLSKNNSIYILDHHASAFETIDALEAMQDQNPNLPITIFCSRDNRYSGAKLTWLYFFMEEETPLVVELVSDGDTWQHQLNDTKPFYSAIGEYFGGLHETPNELFDALLVSNPLTHLLIEKGRVLHDIFLEKVNDYAQSAELKQFHGHPCYVVTAPKSFTSELGNRLAHMCNGIALIYQIEHNGHVYCSLRSTPDIFVNELAEIYNGGGHEHASAFRLPSEDHLHQLF